MRIVKENGFTLIELLIAMTIFAVGLLSLAGMQVSAIQTNSDANVRTASAGLAEGILEEILSWDTDDPRLGSDTLDQAWDFGGGATTRSLPGAGTYAATYSVAVDSPVDSVATVTVLVSGPGRNVILTGFKRTVN